MLFVGVVVAVILFLSCNTTNNWLSMSTGLKSLSFVLFNYLQSNQIQHVVQVHAFLGSCEQGIGPKEARKEEGSTYRLEREN